MKRTGIRRGEGNPIPEESRRIVERREGRLCARCRGAGTDWHHRRSRSVRDLHQHCACNGVLLCRTCHEWAHRYPVQAKAQGFVVARHEAEPGAFPVRRLDGWWLLLCDGSDVALSAEHVVMRGGSPRH